MSTTAFKRAARENGLTTKQLVKLSMCQSEIYHRIRFEGLENTNLATFEMGDIKGKELRTLLMLEEKDLIKFHSGGRISVTENGWNIPCNSGASVFVFGCDDIDIMTCDQLDPITRFGPRFSA